MRLLLVSRTAIVIQIFDLVCKKLNIEFLTRNDLHIEEQYDFIIIDREFIDDQFNGIKQYSKKLGAIYHEELPFEKARDFVIPRPFLPNQLYAILQEHTIIIKEEEKAFLHNNKDKELVQDDENEVIEYVDSLAQDIALDIKEETDESIIQVTSLQDGGVLDHNELDKIQDILHMDDSQEKVQELETQDWLDLSDIIDQAIYEAKTYDFSDVFEGKDSLKIFLDKDNISQLRPLLSKLDHTIMDDLVNGEVINIQLQLKEE